MSGSHPSLHSRRVVTRTFYLEEKFVWSVGQSSPVGKRFIFLFILEYKEMKFSSIAFVYSFLLCVYVHTAHARLRCKVRRTTKQKFFFEKFVTLQRLDGHASPLKYIYSFLLHLPVLSTT